ncbi:MAG: hypothetical protein JXA96_01315 [Sedimentisphaerales bacterium]|nr:hypothetical protein [Sedimentisphaerales bacterium]
MKNAELLPKNVTNRIFRMKYVVSVFLPLFFLVVFVFIVYAIDQNYPTSGDAVIRQVVGQMLNKDPNSLDTKDFRSITELDLSGQTIEDIRLLKKFKNLCKLDISSLKVPKARTPLWKTILIKIHVIKKQTPQVLFRSPKKEEITFLNLRSLRNLSKLEYLNLNFTPIENLGPLSGLKNLTTLDVYGTHVFDLGPVKELSNLKILNLGQTKITNLKPLQELTKLQRLTLYDTAISDIEPVKNFPNLIYFDIRKCNNILHNQIDDLQKKLPELVIFDGREK